MAEEIGRRAATEMGGTAGVGTAAAVLVTPALSAAATHREGYALAAGYALGLVVLASGRSAPGLIDLHLDTRLMCPLLHTPSTALDDLYTPVRDTLGAAAALPSVALPCRAFCFLALRKLATTQ